MKPLESLRIKIFADGADIDTMLRLNDDPLIKGLTTNPSLMRKSGIKDYRAFAKEVLAVVKTKPISFEVFADDLQEMERQAREISSWGENVYVKIPITNSLGESTVIIVKSLAEDAIKVNVTAVLTHDQVVSSRGVIPQNVDSIISIFNGRIMDTGEEPIPPPRFFDNCDYLWASCREPYNIYQAEDLDYDIITVPEAILTKARQFQGYDLDKLSLETVQQFKKDSEGYTL